MKENQECTNGDYFHYLILVTVQTKLMLLQTPVNTVLYLKSLSNTQSYKKYTNVYLYLNHANSLTNKFYTKGFYVPNCPEKLEEINDK